MGVELVPGLAGVPTAKSKISLIDGIAGKLWYRGYAIDELVEQSYFEEVAYLLLSGTLPNGEEQGAFEAELRAERTLEPPVIALLASLPGEGHPMAALAAAVSALALYSPPTDVADAGQRSRATARLIAKVPTLVAAYHRLRSGEQPLAPRDDLGHAANLLWMITGKAPEPLLARVLDACLVLHAEHGMNASTFTARVTASTMATPYAVVAAAIGALSGPLHGGANEDVIDSLREIHGGVAGVQAWAEQGVADGRKFPGFGHRVYKVKDPRAKMLQKLVVQLFAELGTTPLYDVACELETVIARLLGAKGVYANVDFYSGIVYERMGIPADLMTPIFAVARTAGWLAHWSEQLEDNRLYRPTLIYEGDRGLRYVPIEKRG